MTVREFANKRLLDHNNSDYETRYWAAYLDGVNAQEEEELNKQNAGGKDLHSIIIKYHTDIEPLKFIDGKSDWIDLRAAEDVTLKQGEYKIISLGVSMKIPEGYEAHIVPRSSTFKNFGIIQTNGMGIIDSSYCGEDDVWGMPVLAMKDTKIHKGDRLCQFRLFKNMGGVSFFTTDFMGKKSRGGFGSTGIA